MNILKFIILVILIVLLNSCQKKVEDTYEVIDQNGVKVFENSKMPMNPKLSLKAEKLFTIKAQDSLERVENSLCAAFDKDDNLYTLAFRSAKIYKFDKNGKFVKTFCRRGSGPGEVKDAAWFTILNDTILVVDTFGRKIARFNLNGDFIDSKESSANSGNLQLIQTAGNYNFSFNIMFDREKQAINYGLFRYGNYFQDMKGIETSEMKLQELNKDYDMANLVSLFACDKDKIYLAKNSKDIFEIKVLDLDGNLEAKIRKPYRKIRFSKKELADFNQMMDNINGKGHNGGVKMVAEYKNSILGIYTDDKNRLWVERSREIQDDEPIKQNIKFDIFKDNIYQNTVELAILKANIPLDLENQIFIHKDRIYHFRFDEEEIDVYHYLMEE